MDDSDKRLMIRVIIDCLLLVIVGIPVTFIEKLLPTYKRGFFCNDQSILYPYVSKGTVPWTSAQVTSILINIAVIITCELINHRRSAAIPKTYKEKQIPNYLWNCYCILGAFAFGLAANQYLTMLGKFTIGRLRPCFIDACKPKVNCDLAENLNKYITDFECSTKIADGIRQSFPSGHTSFTTYAAVHLIIYLQTRFPLSGLLRNVLQLFFAVSAMFVGLSRISDYRHHPTDVVAGAILGTVVALFVTRFVVNYFDLKRTLRPTLKFSTVVEQT